MKREMRKFKKQSCQNFRRVLDEAPLVMLIQWSTSVKAYHLIKATRATRACESDADEGLAAERSRARARVLRVCHTMLSDGVLQRKCFKCLLR